jgi:hypothetical protein
MVVDTIVYPMVINHQRITTNTYDGSHYRTYYST